MSFDPYVDYIDGAAEAREREELIREEDEERAAQAAPLAVANRWARTLGLEDAA